MMMLYFLIYMFICGVLSFSLNRKHFLMMLLSMEFIVTVLFLIIGVYFINFSYEIYFSMMFLSFSVCESALGLSLLVSLIRSKGTDYFNSLNLLW